MNNILGRIIKKKKKIITIIIKKYIFLPIYKKYKKIFKKINAFDIFNESNFGDFVMIIKSRPIKKTVFFILSKIIEKAKLI